MQWTSTNISPRVLFLLVFVVGCTLRAFGQFGDPLERGNKAFDRLSFVEAIDWYKNAYDKHGGDIAIAMRIAESFRLLNLPDSSVKWYKYLEANKVDLDPIHALHYAEALLSTGERDLALRWYEEYRQEASSDDRSKRRIEGLQNLQDFYKTEDRYEILNMEFNTEATEFSPAFYREGIVFVASRQRESIVKQLYSWDESEFLDLYYWSSESLAGEAQRFHKEINSRFHEGPVNFYKGDTKMVFTRNDFYQGKIGKSSKRVTKLQLYFADRNDDGGWVNIEKFPYNNREYSTGHPTITEDGSVLIFVSDRPGGKGGTDLYLSRFAQNRWQQPVNLETINTEGNEMFPYLAGGHLFFASNGLEGLGGLDIYRVRLDEEYHGHELRNMGAPLNSNRDDFGLIIDEDFTAGYFTSNRADQKDDIYSFTHFPPTSVIVQGEVRYVVDETVVALSSVTAKDANGVQLTNAEAGIKGGFSMALPRNSEATLYAAKDGWNLVQEVPLSTVGNRDTIDNVLLYLQRDELFGLVAGNDKISGELLEDIRVEINPLGESDKLFAKKRVGEYQQFVLEPGRDYLVHVAKEGYFKGTDTLHVQAGATGTLQLEVPMEKIVIGKAIKLDNIYYDVNKSNIREDAARELNNLVTMLEENPSIRIELSSHTDSRGSDVYNLTLSQKRATSAVQYIISQGVESSRIIARGYGESQPVNRCKNGVKCTSDEYQQNRRTEFKVIALMLDNEVN